jgi:hypothetical protein
MNLEELYEKYGTNRITSDQATKIVHVNIQAILAECDDIQVIRIRGWTPRFNDGDPCTHTHVALVENYGDTDFLNDEDVPNQLSDLDDEDLEINSDSPVTQMMVRNNFHFDSAPSRWHNDYENIVAQHKQQYGNKLMAYMIVEGMTGLISAAYHTDFDLTFTLDPESGSLVVCEDHYECGW